MARGQHRDTRRQFSEADRGGSIDTCAPTEEEDDKCLLQAMGSAHEHDRGVERLADTLSDGCQSLR
jgi:hypothetical protein